MKPDSRIVIRLLASDFVNYLENLLFFNGFSGIVEINIKMPEDVLQKRRYPELLADGSLWEGMGWKTKQKKNRKGWGGMR